MSALCFFGILLSKTNIYLLLILYFILGIAFTFESGALESWFVDSIKHKKQTKHLHRLFGRWGSTSAIGFVVGPLIGGMLVTQGINTALWATAFVMLFLSLFTLFLKEEYFTKKEIHIKKSLKETIQTSKKGIFYTLNNKTILLLSIIMTLLTFSITLAFNSYQPYVIQVGLQPEYLGFALSIAGFLSIFTLNYSHKITKFMGNNKKSLIFFTILFGLAITCIGFIQYLPLLFISLISYTMLYEFSSSTSPAYRDLFNKNTPSKIRATVLSVSSLYTKVGEILALLAFGLISTYVNLQFGILLSGILIIITAFLYLRLK